MTSDDLRWHKNIPDELLIFILFCHFLRHYFWNFTYFAPFRESSELSSTSCVPSAPICSQNSVIFYQNFREDGDFNKGKVVTRRHKRRIPNAEAGSQIQADSSFARGQKIYVRTWGCTHNTSDSEYMAGQVTKLEYELEFSTIAIDILW